MNALIAVVVAFLSNGEMDYAAVDATDEADCRQKATQIAHDRLDQNEQEEAKILGFSYECVEFENQSHEMDPTESDSGQPRHVPGKNEA